MKRTNGELKLLFRKKRNGQTYLSKQFYVLPLQITVPYYQDNDGTAFLNPLNMGGGVMGEDHLRTEIELEENSQVLFTNLSATKIFKSHEDEYSLLENEFTVGKDAQFEYLPDYCIPYEEADVEQKTIIRLKESSYLFAVDHITPGRVSSGEQFAYRRYMTDFKLYIEDRLAAIERADIRPNQMDLTRIGMLGEYRDYVTVFIYCDHIGEDYMAALRALMAEQMSGERNSNCGCSLIEKNLVTVKMLGDSNIAMRKAVDKVWRLSREMLLGKPGVRLRKT